MKLSASDILKHMGFDIPEDGIEINPNDLFFISSVLGLVGDTMNPDLIPDAQVDALNRTLMAMMQAWSDAGFIKPVGAANNVLHEDRRLKLRSTIKVLLRHTFKRRQ